MNKDSRNKDAESTKLRKGRRSRKWISWIVLLVLVTVGAVWLNQYSKRPDRVEILVVNEEKVSISEAMVYYRLMQHEFEKMGSEGIWDLEILGLDPHQTAVERVMESIIRIKAMQSSVGVLSPQEEVQIEDEIDKLAQMLGADYMEKHCIDRALVDKVVRENYLAYRYEAEATFLPGSNEEEIENKLEQTFTRYDHLNVQQYTRIVSLQPMMFYTGEWVEGEWVSYSEAQKAVILEEVRSIYDTLSVENFKAYAENFADTVSIEDNPVFAEGAVSHPKMNYGMVYFGQMQQEIAEKVFSTKVGSVSELIETKYGYLIVRIISFIPQGSKEAEIYEERLELVKENYREQIIEELKSQRLEEEWLRLEQESQIQRFDEEWEDYVNQFANAE